MDVNFPVLVGVGASVARTVERLIALDVRAWLPLWVSVVGRAPEGLWRRAKTVRPVNETSALHLHPDDGNGDGGGPVVPVAAHITQQLCPGVTLSHPEICNNPSKMSAGVSASSARSRPRVWGGARRAREEGG